MAQATAADLSNLKFNQWQSFRIASAEVKVLRTGITGELGYELHGSSAAGNDVWAKIVEIGASFNIKQLGVRAQMISHVEAGIATNDRDFISAAAPTKGAPQIKPTARSKIIGSYNPRQESELFRTPAEVGWYAQQSLDSHEFVGRDALIAERDAGGPLRKLVGLVWDNQDVIDIFATLFDEKPILPMELPRYLGLAVDKVLDRGEVVGCSTSRVFSPFLRKMISLGYIDKQLALPGTSLSIIYGQDQGPQRR
jgi:glycine cleavage system aminomethyltransferase T